MMTRISAWISGAANAVATFIRKRFVLVLALVIALALSGAGVAWAAGQGGPAYVTTTVTTGAVEETLALSGTVASASRRDLAFPVSGTVAKIDVKVGARVEAGQTLASLDTEELQEAIDAAEQRVTLAEQQLEDDLDSQTRTSSSSTSTPSASTPTSSTVDLTAEVADVVAAQNTLLGLLAIAEAAEGASAAAMTAASSFVSASCDAFGLEAFEDPLVSGISYEDQLLALQALLVTCQTDLATYAGATGALNNVAVLQAATAAAQADIAGATTALDAAVTALAAKAGSAGTPSPGGGSSPSSSSPSSSSTPSTAGARTATAADITADRAAIAAAEANVAIAEADLAAAVLTSPITGTVAQIAFKVGDDVAAGSDTQVITILGDDGYVVEATVGLADVKKIAVGQTGTATLTSSGASYDATVSAVGFVNVSSGSSPQYSVTISVDAGDTTLLEGAAVQIEIQVAAASDVLVIPISALHRSETGDSVDVLVGGEVSSHAVEVGAIGTIYAEIVSGLSAGDVIVLADPSQAIETPEDTGQGGLTGLTGDQGGTVNFTPPEGFTPPDGFVPPQ